MVLPLFLSALPIVMHYITKTFLPYHMFKYLKTNLIYKFSKNRYEILLGFSESAENKENFLEWKFSKKKLIPNLLRWKSPSIFVLYNSGINLIIIC